MSTWCVYHSSDLDGKCSAAIVRKRYHFCHMIPFNYDDDPNVDRFSSEDTVIMVDVSFPIELMIELKNKVKEFIWIDHHITKINEANENDFSTKGLLDNDFAACENVWRFFYPYERLPYCVKMLGRYDIWKHQDIKGCLEFQYGMRLYDTNPDSGIWREVISNNESVNNGVFERLSKEGEIILKYQKSSNEVYAKSYAFETEFEGHKAIAINKGCCGSMTFESVWDNTKYDIMISFALVKKEAEYKYIVSMYTDKEGIDASVIAKKYGGGGHKQACGFVCKELPFLK